MEKTLDIQKLEADIAKLMAETMKLNDESVKLRAESKKFQRETFWLPVLYASGLIGAVITLTKLFLN